MQARDHAASWLMEGDLVIHWQTMATYGNFHES
jgi:hypothetical protein